MAKGKYQEWLTEDGLTKLEAWARKYKVYMHIFPSGKKYIGITGQTLNERWRKGKGYKDNKYLENALNKYEWDEIEHILLFDNLTKKEAESKEIELIKKHKSSNRLYGYNIQNGGKSPGTLSKEIRDKISKSKKGKGTGKDNPFHGMKHSKETRQRLSIIASKRKHDKITKEKISVSRKIEVYQIDKNGRIIEKWDSAKDAGDSLSIHNTSITAVCRGRRKTAGGFLWEYVGDCNG